MENIITGVAFVLPIIIVLVMAWFDRVFKGKKTYTQGALGLFGALQLTDWGFIPQNAATALVGGVGIAVFIASSLTERAK